MDAMSTPAIIGVINRPDAVGVWPLNHLQVQRQEGHRPEQGQADDEADRAGHRDDAIREERDRKDGLLGAPFDGGEGSQQQQPEQDSRQHPRRGPGHRRASEAGKEHDRRQRPGERRCAEVVDRVPDSLGPRMEDRGDDHQSDRSERKVDVKDPTPRHVVDEEAAHKRAPITVEMPKTPPMKPW
jgi:hypothetical protein